MTTSDPILHKVTAFITRDGTKGRDLLVFRHPTAGIQLPAGTVEVSETPETAVLREVREETGLDTDEVTLLANLGTIPQPLAPNERVLTRAAMLQTAPGDHATLLRKFLERGWRVRVEDAKDGFLQVVYEEFDFRSGKGVVAQSLVGWLPEAVLSQRVERHLFHLRPLVLTPETWSIRSDLGHEFTLYWTPLSKDPGLVSGQAEWLAHVRERLRA